jgi:hypothetical protein
MPSVRQLMRRPLSRQKAGQGINPALETRFRLVPFTALPPNCTVQITEMESIWPPQPQTKTAH